jgi:hypothetical protein
MKGRDMKNTFPCSYGFTIGFIRIRFAASRTIRWNHWTIYRWQDYGGWQVCLPFGWLAIVKN